MNKTLKLTSVAMLTALAVLANLFTIPLTPNFSRVISFTIVVTFVAGIYPGPISGLTVGFLGDFIAHFINPMGGMGYNWFIGLSCALTGLIAGLVYSTFLASCLAWNALFIPFTDLNRLFTALTQL